MTEQSDDRSPFHPGELAVQERDGARERAERLGRRGIREFMPDQHRAFFAVLPWLLVGSLDGQDRPWASALTGRPGFVSSPDPRTLSIAAARLPGDPLAANLQLGAPVGLLGIEPETRRRNRMNGTVVAQDADGFAVRVGQSFGNCPQYIQARAPTLVADPPLRGAANPEGTLLSAAAAALIRAADTFFIATAAPGARRGDPVAGVDVSHRGGRPGFVRVDAVAGRSVLTVPDFAGNRAFNTFGNLALDPRAGLLFPDFATGDLLALSGAATVIWDGTELAGFAGAQRLLRFELSEGWAMPQTLPLRWSAPQPAPQLAATGRW